jgi:hypothetical protein
MTRPPLLVLTLLPAIAAPAGPGPAGQPPLFLTGRVEWPADAGVPVLGRPGDDAVTLRGNVPSARIGPAAVAGAHRVLDVSRGATVGALEVEGVRASVTDGCIRAHAASIVVRGTHCRMSGGPQAGGVNMPFGLDVTAAAAVLVEDSSFEGFRWRSAPDRYWNGDGISIEKGVTGATFRRVTANDNTDAGFDIRPHAVLSDVSAAGNCRNFRFWSGADAGTLTTGDSMKRGGISACSGIWLNGAASGPAPKLHIRKLVVRMSRPGMIIEVETGPADIAIDRCDISAPPGTTMVRFEKGVGEVRLGPGCDLERSRS